MRRTNTTKKKCPCCNAAPRELHNLTCKRALKQTFALTNYGNKYRARVRDNEILENRAKRRKKLYRRRCSGGAATPTRRSGRAFVGNEIMCRRSDRATTLRTRAAHANEIVHLRCVRANTIAWRRTRVAQQACAVMSHARPSQANEITRARAEHTARADPPAPKQRASERPRVECVMRRRESTLLNDKAHERRATTPSPDDPLRGLAALRATFDGRPTPKHCV